jgi:hypothetical protein
MANNQLFKTNEKTVLIPAIPVKLLPQKHNNLHFRQSIILLPIEKNAAMQEKQCRQADMIDSIMRKETTTKRINQVVRRHPHGINFFPLAEIN